MVIRARRAADRGFTLAEVVVSLVLLSAGVLVGVGAVGAAARALTAAELEERAAVLGGEVADSLLQSAERGSAGAAGERRDGPVTVRWAPDADGYIVAVVWATRSDSARLALRVRAPRLPVFPGAAP